jgi:hypothetical protein
VSVTDKARRRSVAHGLDLHRHDYASHLASILYFRGSALQEATLENANDTQPSTLPTLSHDMRQKLHMKVMSQVFDSPIFDESL